jgi:hypothetical protein
MVLSSLCVQRHYRTTFILGLTQVKGAFSALTGAHATALKHRCSDCSPWMPGTTPGMTISVAFNNSVMAGLVPAIDDPNGCLAPTFFGALELEF